MDHVLILGAGTGIGAALARRIARPELRLLLHTRRNRDGLGKVARDCRNAGAEPDLCLGDLAAGEPFAQIGSWLDQLPKDGLAGLVFAAGYARLGTIHDTPAEALSGALQAMPMAFHRLMTIAAPKLARRTGRVVCVSAFGAHTARPFSYAATAPAKSALEAQVMVFATNLASRGITVNAVVPGFIEKEPGTPSSLTPEQWAEVNGDIPMQRIGSREEVAATIAFLLSREAGYITGQTIHVDGGLTL